MRKLILSLSFLFFVVPCRANPVLPGYSDGCGVLVQGVKCVLFQSDAGGLCVLSNLGNFGVGDRVRVRGVLNPDCSTICMQANGCIEHRQSLIRGHHVDVHSERLLRA